MSKNLAFPGQVTIKSLKITGSKKQTVDVTKIVEQIDLYEDLFGNTMSGSLIVKDSVNLVNTVPLIGEETLEFEIETPGSESPIKKIFYIYKMDSRVFDKQRQQVYALHFVSKESIASVNTKVAEAFKGPIHDNVIDIYKRPEYISAKNEILIEDTQNEFKFIAPYWTPFETINWLAKRAISKDGAANYLFFESNKSYEFVSASKLMSGEPQASFVYSDVSAETILGSASKNEDKLRFVRRLFADVGFDYLRGVASGLYNSELASLDITFKNVRVNTFNYLEQFNKTKHLEDQPLQTAQLISNKLASLYFITEDSYRFTERNPQRYQDWFLQNNSLMEQLSKFKLTIEVPGNTKLKVGHVVNFSMPSYGAFGSSESTEIVDKTFSGKYLISAIRHKIVEDNHTMFIEIIKDSVAKPLLGT